MNWFFRNNVIWFLGIVLPWSCTVEPEIDLQLPDALIVVDGSIEQGEQARVFLTTNTPYFTTIDSASLRDLVLSRALVTLDDGENSEVLILRKDSRYFPPYYYAGNSIYGDTGKVYTLSASYGGKSIIAQTTVPGIVELDNCSFELAEESDSLGSLILEFTDPRAEKNFYRIFTKRLGEDEKFIPSLIIAINDQYFNGDKVTLKLYRAPDSFLSTEGSEYYSFDDTIVVKLCTMDEQTFDFWNTYQEEAINATNPFASSMINLESNIEGDGLGVWGGYGVSYDTVFGGR